MFSSILNFVKVFWAYNVGLMYVILFSCGHEILDNYPLHIASHTYYPQFHTLGFFHWYAILTVTISHYLRVELQSWVAV